MTLQHLTGARKTGEAGYAMAALLVGLAVMSIMMAVAMPTWRHMMQRERETELAFRGEQYARAVGLFQRKYAAAFPPSIDVLIEQKFLRKKYKDPITNDDFQILYQSQSAQRPGETAGPQSGGSQRPGTAGGSQQTRGRPRTGVGSDGEQPSFGGSGGALGPKGGVLGVASKSKDPSIRMYKGRSRYNEWEFVYVAATTDPGSDRPGQVPGQGGPGRPGVGGRPGANGRSGDGQQPGSGGFPTTFRGRGNSGSGPGGGPGGQNPQRMQPFDVPNRPPPPQ